jgi:lipopolysaccharide heptosyltransferase II
MNDSCYKKNSSQGKRVLIVDPFGIGDALFATPVIRALKENGFEKIDLLLGSRTRELFEHNPHISEIFEWDKTKRDGFLAQARYISRLVKLFWRLRQNHYQLLLDFSLSREYALLAWLFFGISKRAGFDYKKRGIFLTNKMELPDGFSQKPVAEYYLDLLKSIGIKEQPCRLELFLGEEDEKECTKILNGLEIRDRQTFIVVAPGGGESWGKDARLKRWPAHYFGALLSRIKSELLPSIRHIFILGSRKENSLAEELSQSVEGLEVHNLSGGVSLRVAAALIQKAAFLIANDGGLVHISQAMGTPVIAFYGPVDPRVYGPYPKNDRALAIVNTGPICRPCYKRMRYQADCVGNECLTTLTPGYVFRLIQSAGFFEILESKKNSDLQ